MKKILLILLCFAAIHSYGQGGWTRPNTSYGNRQYRAAFDSSLLIPTGSDVPGLHAYDLGQSAFYYRTGVGLYVYDPTAHTWSLVGSGGGGGTGGDSVISFQKNITEDSIILLLNDGRRFAVKDSIGTGGGGGSQDLQSVLTVGNIANLGIVLTTHEGVQVSDTADANSYSNLGVQENINGGFVELQNVNGFHGTLYAGNLTSNLGYQFANQTGTIPMSVSVNGGTQIQAGTDGNIDLTVSGSGATIIRDSIIVDCSVTPASCFDGLHSAVSIPISASTAKNIDILPASNSANGFGFGWSATQAILTYPTAITGTYKFYIIYYE